MISSCQDSFVRDCFSMRIVSPDFALGLKSKASLENREPGLLCSLEGKKTSVWAMRPSAAPLVRPENPESSRQVLRRYADLPGPGDPKGLLSTVRRGETREAGFFGRQPVLYETFCLLHRPSLSKFDDLGCSQGISTRLEHGQSLRDTIHAGAVATKSSPKAADRRNRRSVSAKGACLPDCRQRSGSPSPDLVWGTGPIRGKHGYVL